MSKTLEETKVELDEVMRLLKDIEDGKLGIESMQQLVKLNDRKEELLKIVL